MVRNGKLKTTPVFGAPFLLLLKNSIIMHCCKIFPSFFQFAPPWKSLFLPPPPHFWMVKCSELLVVLQMQQLYQDASSQGSEGVLIERLKVQFENNIIKQLSLKVKTLSLSPFFYKSLEQYCNIISCVFSTDTSSESIFNWAWPAVLHSNCILAESSGIGRW